jgi:hypothetical protein
LLFVLIFVCITSLIRVLNWSNRHPRLARPGRMQWQTEPGAIWLHLLAIRQSERLAVRLQLIGGAGVKVHPLRYEAVRRFGIVGCAALTSAVCIPSVRHLLPVDMPTSYVLALGGVGLILLTWDAPLLEMLKKRRVHRIVKEIHAVSTQLLYYTGSRMSLHGKLQRCVPHTKATRDDFRMLLQEWYGDAGEAIRRFRRRLGTEEGFAFAETLNSIRMHDSEAYYDLLRQRVGDYKEKLDLLKESKKETTSYILFVIAGLPILNTFRVFIYPWVMEGQKLFGSLN